MKNAQPIAPIPIEEHRRDFSKDETPREDITRRKRKRRHDEDYKTYFRSEERRITRKSRHEEDCQEEGARSWLQGRRNKKPIARKKRHEEACKAEETQRRRDVVKNE